nr:hypothetical transcript [Hymenolepis microstoma]
MTTPPSDLIKDFEPMTVQLYTPPLSPHNMTSDLTPIGLSQSNQNVISMVGIVKSLSVALSKSENVQSIRKRSLPAINPANEHVEPLSN